MWKAKGDVGMEKHVDKALDNAQYLMEALKKRKHFRLVIPQVPDYEIIPKINVLLTFKYLLLSI